MATITPAFQAGEGIARRVVDQLWWIGQSM
jgi:hypothetical protein